MNPLKTDYKNDELTPSMNGKRHYAIKDSDGITTIYPDVILEDVSEYDVHGDEFGKDDINAMNDMANKNYEDNKVILTKVINLDEQLENAEMYAEEARLAKNNAIMYSSYAEEAAEQARIAADKASEFTPEGYDAFVSSTESHLSTLDESVESLQDQIGSHENLLDNPWFTVNQRGQSEYVGSGSKFFTVDRWALTNYNTDSKVIVNYDGSITLTAPTSGKQNEFCSKISYDDLSRLNGKTITLSIMLDNKEVKSIIIPNFDSSKNETYRILLDDVFVFDLRINPSSNYYAVRVFKNSPSTTGNITIKAVKLELGTVSTLATDTPPNYELEKYKCTMSTADSADTYANGGMIKGTLTAGSTSITITDSRITTDSVFRFFTSKFGVSPTGATVNNGSIILTFESQSEPITVGVKLE